MSKLKKQILVIDDEPAWLQILSYILQRKGYEVLIAQNGADALETLKNVKLDLIVSDIRMPEMNGFELLEQVKHTRKNSRTPFVFVTAIDDYESRKTAQNLGAVDYLTKPFNEDDVVTILSRYVDPS